MRIPNVFQTYSKRIPTPRAPSVRAVRSRGRTATLLTLLPLATLCASPALAAGKFVVPEGCEAFVTVQHNDCQVSHHYTCERDPKGDQWSVYGGPEGPYYMSRIDSETRWMESHDLITPESDALGQETDPASFTDLLDKGRDDFDFTTISSTGEERRYKGYDQMTGKDLTIDGQTFAQTEFRLETFDGEGNFLHRRTGRQMISRDWRLFFSDAEHFENAFGDEEDSVSTPVTFAFPGEKGFLSGTPQFGCDQIMTMLDVGALPASDRGTP